MSFKAKYNEKTGGWDYEPVDDDTFALISGIIVFLIIWAFIVLCMWYSGGDPVSHTHMPWG